MIDDAQDRAAMVRYNGADYFYVYNLQGDVVAYGGVITEQEYQKMAVKITNSPDRLRQESRP